jgi:hypothetical protein
VIVNNFTNINKTNNNLSPEIIEHKKNTLGIRNAGPGWGLAQKYSEGKPVNGEGFNI